MRSPAILSEEAERETEEGERDGGEMAVVEVSRSGIGGESMVDVIEKEEDEEERETAGSSFLE